ncbi:TPA: GNAT family N-acetyltransferase [Pseudomonas aeruginosa]|uniref:GNAT family N-acetyltransferase n=2 Tax=Pseudomonas aeruginosa TaxID=287 RepID=A0A7M3ANY8_PSEAI|nr:GNAT family N-acetyltransferase [Pseudomonas aeruginosa]EKW0093402.1 GNAT family N-acetyltransferase [Pseudomonas aeruginosa]MBD3154722.1 GNAT family N-acetyltransferase [Pseudomonas aeruginosa]MBS9757103.1 GNAT family N-acetyltransferase [Pseudomonas aeruginosa]MCM8576310.1 GNAT family N-acetyltransferase [Pseudomonas aeruginosa]MCR6603641.1 GNAT family N-acetyltransferase [Pseudomonas aeruginosa]
MTLLTYRPAKPDDAALCINIRGLTRENAFSEEELRELGITVESWSKGIQDGSCPGFIASAEGQMIGYCFGDRDTGEIVVLALLPEYEGQGVGKRLLAMVIEELKKHEFHRLFLSCSSDPNVRSYGFYRRLGWSPTGEKDEYGDEILEIKLKHY